MILYHGSNKNIAHINLAMCRPYKDFGRGFYLTEFKEQANKMAKRVSRIYGGQPVLNIFELDDDFIQNKKLNILDFRTSKPEDWAKFVMNNRNRDSIDHKSLECNFDNKYDIVIGPIADDDMAILFRQYQSELISFDMLVRGMTFRDITNQYSFHTERAIALLKKVGAEL